MVVARGGIGGLGARPGADAVGVKGRSGRGVRGGDGRQTGGGERGVGWSSTGIGGC